MLEYKVYSLNCDGGNADYFEEGIMRLLAKGWVPCGGVATSCNKGTDIFLSQALTRPMEARSDMAECKMCGDTEDPPETHVCTDGAIYQHYSMQKDPEGFDRMVKEIQRRSAHIFERAEK